MEVNKKSKHRSQQAAKPVKMSDFTDVTILNTPLPQASSTVDRRSLMQAKPRRSNLDEQNSKHRQLNFDYSNATEKSGESSLGIIQNISLLLDDSTLDDVKIRKSPERERELARKLLLNKCSDPITTNLSKPDKENNVNTSNLQKISNMYSRPSSVNKSTQSTSNQVQNQIENQRESLEHQDEISNTTDSIIFEHNEISARSSEFNKTPEKTDPFPQNFSGISYNSNLAGIQGQFGDEEFMSGSKAENQIMADELSWRKFKMASLPLSNSNGKDRLDLSCFSTGIISGGDLTVDGGRVSVGEYFKRKCGGTSNLSTASVFDRPSIGLETKSPQRHGKLKPLVDETITTENSSYPEEKESKSADCTKDPSVMSLSSIAQAVQDFDSATPRKLVDQILDANRKKRKQKEKNKNYAGDTYTLIPENRISLPASASSTFLNDKPEKDTTKSSYGNKLSLDSKNPIEFDSRAFHDLMSEATFHDPKIQRLLQMNLDDTLPETTQQSETKSDDHFFFKQNQQSLQKSPNASVPRAESSIMPAPRQMLKLSNIHNKFMNSVSVNNESSLIHDTGPSDCSEPTMTKSESTAKEDTLTDSLVKNQSFDTKKVEIGQKTQELCTCLVGIPKEADFELYNGTDRWILCSLKLHQIQGERDNIELDLPEDNILIEPDARKSFKIGARMPRMGKLIIAIFHIPCVDMVTRTSWYMKHLMCFVPEEPDIQISIPSEDDTMNFQTITEETSNSLPITFENKNTIDVPVILRLSQDKPSLFSIGDCLDDTVGSTNNQRESISLILKPNQPLSINIDFKGISLESFGEKVLRKGVHNSDAKLMVLICFKENEEYLIKEVPLKGSVGSCKLDIIDVRFPLILQPRINRLINVKNSGSIVVIATVDIVQSKESQNESRDFFICPNNIVLNGGDKLALQIFYKPENNKTDKDRHAMIRIVVGNKVSFYPVIGEKVVENEQFCSESFNQFQRSETPQHLRSISSPSSPHSLIFNRSGNSGRHSPGSTNSAVTGNGAIVPIRSTHTALVWGSIRIGKSDTKQFTIRNTSNNKIKLIAKIKADDQNFKFMKDRHTMTTTITLSLQGMESKTLFVLFTPNYPRASAAKILFSHYSALKETREITGFVKTVQLYGYGGYGKINISEAVKDTSGQMWLSLGKLNSEGILHAKIRLHNTGDLTCFAKMKLTPKALYPSVALNWNIEPGESLVAPNETQWISLEFRPRKDDLATIHQVGVIHVGTLKIIHGDEPTRLRIRRLYNKLKDSDQLSDKMDEQGDEFKEVIQRISKAFPGETFTKDLKLIGDSVQNLGDLCKGIIQNEVKLTVEVHPDETISMLQDNLDDSQIFYSLCSDHDDESHFGGESFMPAD